MAVDEVESKQRLGINHAILTERKKVKAFKRISAYYTAASEADSLRKEMERKDQIDRQEVLTAPQMHLSDILL